MKAKKRTEKNGGRDDSRKKRAKCARKSARRVTQEEARVQKVEMEAEPKKERFVF